MKNTYRTTKIRTSAISGTEGTEGMTIETMVALFMNNQTDIERTQPVIYTERREGIMAGFDIRTDRFDIALEAMDKSAKSQTAKRESRLQVVTEEENPKGDSVQGTDNE